LNTKIYNLVIDSFKNITLNGGIGFFQAIAIDNLLIDEENGKEKFQKEINKDEMYGKDWTQLIPYLKENEIDLYPFSFMDEKGILYILPVLMCLELEDELSSLLNKIHSNSHLWKKNIWNEILNNSQRKTIIEVYTYWNTENLDDLKSFGMSDELAIAENKKNNIYKMLENLKQQS